jgi:hypothetical protein
MDLPASIQPVYGPTVSTFQSVSEMFLARVAETPAPYNITANP